MKISHEFTVQRPIGAVWALFQDVPAVAQCLPGAELLEDKGDGTYVGKVSVKLGPMSATFEGEATVEPDEAQRQASIQGKGVDRRGGSRGQVNVEYRLAEMAGATQVNLDAEVTLSGAAAQFGRGGLINEMSTRLIGEFVECLEAKLAAGTVEEAAEIEAEEVRGISLFFSSLAATIVRFFKRLLGRGN
jgi:carbon monoxide dehydrogenase subunit G